MKSFLKNPIPAVAIAGFEDLGTAVRSQRLSGEEIVLGWTKMGVCFRLSERPKN
jgi:hypothetical protein